MSVTRDPAKPELVAAQKEAIAAKRGLWAHGVPDYVLTSLHTTAEDTEGKGTYNRLVSTADGHSLKWKHENDYPECTAVCDIGADHPDRIAAAVQKLKSDPEAKDVVDAYLDKDLTRFVGAVAQGADLTPYFKLQPQGRQAIFERVLTRYKTAGLIGRKLTGPPACMRHVAYGPRRFGGGRAECLK